MKSHQYLCRPRELGRCLLPTLAVLAALAALLRMARHWDLLPPVPAGTDPDSTVLLHQARATRSAGPADILIAGDSTCLVGVDALELSRRLPGNPRVLSLASFIWLDLGTYGDAVATFAAAHPGQPRAVILLVTAPKLAGAPQDQAGRELWQQAMAAPASSSVATERNGDWLGASTLRRRLLAYGLATPLQGGGAAFFGFSSEIDKYLEEHHGSLVTFGTSVTPRGANKPEWRLSKEMESDTRAFRAKVPAGVKLFIGLTPQPEGTAPADSARLTADMLWQWNQWLQADGILTNLPPSFPDIFFAGGGHLNEVGQKRFTAAVAKELAPRLSR